MTWLILARMSAATGLRQPATWLATAAAIGLLGMSAIFGLFTFHDADRIRLLANAGVALQVILGLFIAITVTATSIRHELTSHTAATLFAKPVERGAFIVGKWLGGSLAAIIPGMILCGLHLGLLVLVETFGFDVLAPAADNRQLEALATNDQIALSHVFGNHILALLHSMVMAAVTTALATRLPLAASLIAGFAVFVASHLLSGIGIPGAVVLPALGLLRADGIFFAHSGLTPLDFILCAAYAGLYVFGCLLVALAGFIRHDVA